MMFEQYSYKIKFKALLVIIVLLSVTAYKKSFSTLISVFKENRALSSRVQELKGTTGNLKALEQEIDMIDRVLGKGGADKEKIQQKIMAFAATHNKHPSIYNLAPIHTFQDDDFRTYTNRLEVTGNTNQLLQLSYDFEKNFETSRLVGLHFYTIKKGSSKPELHLNMIFQNYENNK
ncbi:hypothetical protein [Flavobacterium rhizosphaerae]|uniref:Uncharacterized protein n=1 Tax=Flavobacterium rhizosphaerae TaxID=3163298 RepID=A0ABW8YWT3_9FLAO